MNPQSASKSDDEPRAGPWRDGPDPALSDATIREIIREEGLTQARAADLFGVTQPRVSDLVRGKIEPFSIDAPVNMLAATGHQVSLYRAIEAMVPIIAETPLDQKKQSTLLKRLWESFQEDRIPYIETLGDHRESSVLRLN